MIIDLRSDTVTLPTPGMRAAMANAPLGDDVFGEDPSVQALQDYAAGLLGMEAALFMASGTMTNQIAIKAHTRPGDEVICEPEAHVYLYEGGGIAFHSGASVRLVPGDRGRMNADDIATAINADDIHHPITRLVCVENTFNRGGGSYYDLAELQKIRSLCTARGLALHMDGARLFNALVATGHSPKQYGALFDSISICLSKGLGAPVGSLLLGKRDFIQQAKRLRKVMGGGWRQAGMLAAAGLYALQHQVTRLADDHRRAKKVGEAFARKPWVAQLFPVDTNIVLLRTTTPEDKQRVVAALKEQDILVGGFGPVSIRLVLHLDIDDDKLQTILQALVSL